MQSLEEQIQSLADAAFAASDPVAIPKLSDPTRKRNGFLLVAAAVVIGLAATSALLGSRNDNDLMVAASDPDEIVTVEDALQIDLTALVAQSAQARIRRLAGVPIVDTDALGDLVDVQGVSLVTTSGVGGPYEYWQQVVVRTSTGTRLVVDVRGSETALPLGAGFGPDSETEVRGKPGRTTDNKVAWLESEQLRIEIVDGSAGGFEDVIDEALSLADRLVIVSASGQWTSRAEEFVPPTVQGDPIIAGVVASVDWDVVENEIVDDAEPGTMPVRELTVRAGDAEQVVFRYRYLLDNPTDYAIAPASVPGGVVIIGTALSEVDQVELVLENGTRVVVPTVQLAGGPAAFAIPIDDRLDPKEIQLLSSGVAFGGPFDLAYLSPYHAGSSVWN